MLTPEVAESLANWNRIANAKELDEALDDIEVWIMQLENSVEEIEERFTRKGMPFSPMIVRFREIHRELDSCLYALREVDR